MGHSIIPPSSAGIWGSIHGCTGWVNMTQQFPDNESDNAALEGEASHEIAALLVDAHAHANSGQLRADRYVDTPHSNGVMYSQEMFDAAEIYANDVASIMDLTRTYGGDGFNIEQRITAPSVHAESYGTPDMWIFDPKSMSLYIWDYKYGHGVVEAYENWQLINYLSGIFDKLKIDGVIDQNITVHMRIIQPRAFHNDGIIREWTINGSELRGYFNVLHLKAHEALSSSAVCHTGPHCRYCTARHACAPALSAGLLMYEMSAAPTPVELSPQALGVQLAIIKRALKQLEYLESGFEEQIKSIVRSGTLVPGWMVQQGKGREKWKMNTTEVLALGDLLGHDLRKPDNIITPNQARKLGIDESVIKAYSVTPSTGIKIVSDNGNKAKQVFNS